MGWSRVGLRVGAREERKRQMLTLKRTREGGKTKWPESHRGLLGIG